MASSLSRLLTLTGQKVLFRAELLHAERSAFANHTSRYTYSLQLCGADSLIAV